MYFMAEETIAQQLKTLVDAKKSITAAINESAVGTTQEENISKALFSEYGDIIKAIFAVQDQKEGEIDLDNLYTLNKLACYYIDGSKASSVAHQPFYKDEKGEEETKPNFWLLTASVVREVLLENGTTQTVLDNVIQVAVRRTKNSTLSRLHIRVSETIDTNNNKVTAWNSWFEYAPQSVIESSILGGGEGNNIVFATSGEVAPTKSSTAGQIYVDTVTRNIYIYDGAKWQLMNSWQ